MNDSFDIIIIGSGPAGLAAGLYTSRSKLHTLILERESFGGKLSNRDLIENYPSYPDGILGPELVSRMLDQVINYRPEIQLGEVGSIQINGKDKVVETSFGEYAGSAIIIAGGAHNKALRVPGEQEFLDRGVFHCATCDGPKFTDKVVAVVGGGDAGITEGLLLSKLAAKVVIIEMLPKCTAIKILQERAFSNPRIEIKCSTKVEGILGEETVQWIKLLDMKTHLRSNLQVDGILIYTGLEPNTNYLRGFVPLDNEGYILVNKKMETEIPGIFAAGDIRHDSAWQIATAVGDGATAAISAERFLAKN
jgi:thioredoxin reductase (NADPH)